MEPYYPENAPVFVGFRFFTSEIHVPYHKTDFPSRAPRKRPGFCWVSFFYKKNPRPIPQNGLPNTKKGTAPFHFSLYLGGGRTFSYQGANLSYTTQGAFLYHRSNNSFTRNGIFNSKKGIILRRALCYTKNNSTPHTSCPARLEVRAFVVSRTV